MYGTPAGGAWAPAPISSSNGCRMTASCWSATRLRGEGPYLSFRSSARSPTIRRAAELQAGTIHQANTVAQTDLPAADADPNITVNILPSTSTGYIAFQQCIEPFDKIEVRKAIAHAVNWER